MANKGKYFKMFLYTCHAELTDSADVVARNSRIPKKNQQGFLGTFNLKNFKKNDKIF